MSFLAEIAGAKGCDYQSGAGTITAPGGKKIFAIGVHSMAVITNFKYTPKGADGRDGNQKTETSLNWLGVSLDPTAVTAFIPLGVEADSVEVASGDIMVYYK